MFMFVVKEQKTLACVGVHTPLVGGHAMHAAMLANET